MRVLRNEESDPTEHGHVQFSPGPRAALLRDLENAWRPGHPIQTLREEIDARERGARGQLAHVLKNAHATDAVERNRFDDAAREAGLSHREKLAASVADMWKSSP